MRAGIAFHVHHDRLVEYCYDFDERVKYIKEHKSPDERELRLRLFQLIPKDRLPKKGLAAFYKARDAFYKGCNAHNKARDVYNKARDAYYKERDAYDAYDAHNKARDAFYKGCDALDKARDVYNKARDAYYKDNKEALEKLHTELCPSCTWDGKSILKEV